MMSTSPTEQCARANENALIALIGLDAAQRAIALRLAFWHRSDPQSKENLPIPEAERRARIVADLLVQQQAQPGALQPNAI